jgi:hypothetical protein
MTDNTAASAVSESQLLWSRQNRTVFKRAQSAPRQNAFAFERGEASLILSLAAISRAAGQRTVEDENLRRMAVSQFRIPPPGVV